MDFRNKLLGLQFLVRPVFHLIFVSACGSDTSQKRIDVLVYWPDIKTHCQNHYHQEPEPTTQTWLKWVKSAAWGHQPKNLFHQDASLSQIFEIVKDHYPPSIIMIAWKSRASIRVKFTSVCYVLSLRGWTMNNMARASNSENFVYVVSEREIAECTCYTTMSEQISW